MRDTMIGAYGERNACFVDEILFVDKMRICTGLDINTNDDIFKA